MAGLLNAKKEPTADLSAADSPEVQDEKPNVSKQEQAQYREFVTNGMSLLNDKKGIDKTLQAIAGDGNPVEGLANVVAGIVMRVEDSAKENGMEIGGDVMSHGGKELLEQAADLAEQAGIHTFTEDELESALYMAFDIYRESRQSQGKLQKEPFEQDLQELQAAEADGTLEQEMPGLAELSQRTPPEAIPQGAIPQGGPPQGAPQGPPQPQQGPPQRGLMG